MSETIETVIVNVDGQDVRVNKSDAHKYAAQKANSSQKDEEPVKRGRTAKSKEAE